MPTSTVIVAVTVFAAVAALTGAVLFWLRDMGKTAAEERLAQLTGKKSAEGTLTRDELMREGFEGVAGALGGIAEKFGDVGMFLEQADSPLKPQAVVGAMGGCAVAGTLIALIARAPAPLLPLAAVVGGALPIGWLWWRRRGRFKSFAKQLPDALELIGRALRSGHSLASGLHVVVEEMPAPVSVEFSRAYEEQNLGIPIEQALKNMLKRMPNLDLKFFVTAVAIQRQAGGDLAEILDKISYIIRERFKIMGQVQALTGEGRISGVVLMGLPIALFIAVYYLNPTYVMLLFTEELGRQMIAAAAVLQVLGAIAIKKIVNIKI
ncbi:MAG TPA: type II secretion system F family protein [Planctomycetaceae bacterium]